MVVGGLWKRCDSEEEEDVTGMIELVIHGQF